MIVYQINFRAKEEELLDIQESVRKIVTSGEDGDDYSILVADLKDSVLDHINEFHTELETRCEWI